MFSRYKKLFIIIGVAVVAIAVAAFFISPRKKAAQTDSDTTVARVSRGSISRVLEGSGTLEAIEQYEVTSLVSGDVLYDYFEEGDMVAEGDVMYKIDDSAIEKNISRAQNAVKSGRMTYDESVKSVSDLTVKSTASGVVANVYIKNGDTVQQGAKICDIINKDIMILKIPFLAQQAGGIYVGQSAKVEITGESYALNGKVKNVATGTLTNSLGASVVNVEIEVQNPGSIMESTKATAMIGNIACAEVGTFSYSASESVTAKGSGTARHLNILKGDKVYAGQVLLILENDTVTNNLQKSALSLSDAQLSLENYYDDLDQYNLTAPISGKVIQKSVKAGDKISANMGSTSMAVIADLSAFKFSMSVDELDITGVEVGQKVSITADALAGQTFEGVVNNVSIVGTSSNGVTTYPVEILIEDVEGTDLIPGMNVTATIVLEEKDNVLLVPVTAVERGNRVTMSDGNEVRQVETGINDGNMIEIISGLKEGDEVIIKEFQASSLSDNIGKMRGNMMGGMGSGDMSGGGGAPGGMQ